MHSPRPALQLPDDVNHLVRVQHVGQPLVGAAAVLLALAAEEGGVVGPVGLTRGGDGGEDGLGLEVGHALGLAPDVEVAPPLVDRAGGGQVAGKKRRTWVEFSIVIVFLVSSFKRKGSVLHFFGNPFQCVGREF